MTILDVIIAVVGDNFVIVVVVVNVVGVALVVVDDHILFICGQ